ncbi:unnamed protein product [Nezara viridula]|uniref:type I protein arginine methyltransferase n=1 Tax=Nezara viridula TaxID=85310 RepID=A0A9P0EBB3_NEZVI|nr:unnamed protein product [Nezara viridula]
MSDNEGTDSSDIESGSDNEMEEAISVNCLFCPTVSFSVGESADHCLFDHGFDIRNFIRKRVSSHYDFIKLINYLRQKKPTTKELEAADDIKPWISDDYLLPVFPDDPWLWTDNGLVVDDDEDMEPKYVNAENGVVTLSKEHFDELQEKNQKLEHLLREQEKKMDALRNLLQEEPEIKHRKIVHHVDSYFESYSGFDIHREMLGDIARMEAYQRAINSNFFKEKVVLDVGCGTGILSMMAAKAGASKVVGVDNSDIFNTAVEIVRDNGFESKITLIKGAIENIILEDKFDIIISEWMGYFLLFERMLESIIIARDRFLKKDGLLLPSSCSLWLAGCSDSVVYSERTNSYFMGFKMEPLRRARFSEPAIEIVPEDKIVTKPVVVHRIALSDRETVNTANCCSFCSDFSCEVVKDCELTSICGWFDCSFEPIPEKLSTSPFSIPTHWAQTNFYLKRPLKVEAGNTLVGKIRVAPKGNRGLQVTIELPSVNETMTYALQ